MGNFEDLELYKECQNFRIEISNLVKTFPNDEPSMIRLRRRFRGASRASRRVGDDAIRRTKRL